ncbi:MAG: citrate synthase family protein [Myxococcota bacterium]|nr:citrate synthase family protein [Myxococcota bacterium]
MAHHSTAVPAREAAEMLGIKLATLYAYTSRGLIRSVPGRQGRERRYLWADLEALRSRRERREPAAARGTALNWGEPVLDTQITSFGPDGPVYRSRAALELAGRDTPFESVAEFLWTATLPDEAPVWTARDLGVPASELLTLMPDAPTQSPLTPLDLLLPVLAARDPSRFDTRAPVILAAARILIRRMTAATALPGSKSRVRASLRAPSIAHGIAAALGAPETPRAVAALNRALVLMADHELNASTFTARVVASTGADLCACISAAIGALSGPLHGGATARVAALAAETARPAQASAVLQSRFQRGELVPGFGHELYPAGDPRAHELLRLARELAPRNPKVRTLFALIDAMQQANRPAANVDTGLVALTAALGLPDRAAPALFCIGRSAGWVAHILEQYQAGFLMRPRARYLRPD